MGAPAPLFIAYDSGGTLTQPITTRPTVAVRSSDEDIILFGTGKFIENSDADVPVSPATYQLQTFYGIIDNGTAQVAGRDTANTLQQQTILTQTTFSGGTVRTISENDVTGSDTGWYLDLDDPNVAALDGERVIANPVLRGDLIFFFTYITADNPCAASSDGFIMVMDALNGANLEDGVFDTNGDGIIDDADLIDTDGDGIGDTPAAGIGGAGGAGGGTFISGDGSLDFILTSDDSSGTQSIDQTGLEKEDYVNNAAQRVFQAGAAGHAAGGQRDRDTSRQR